MGTLFLLLVIFGNLTSGTGSADPAKIESVSSSDLFDMSISEIQNLLGPPQYVRPGKPTGTRNEGIGPLETAVWKGSDGSQLEVTTDESGNVVSWSRN